MGAMEKVVKKYKIKICGIFAKRDKVQLSGTDKYTLKIELGGDVNSLRNFRVAKSSHL